MISPVCSLVWLTANYMFGFSNAQVSLCHIYCQTWTNIKFHVNSCWGRDELCKFLIWGWFFLENSKTKIRHIQSQVDKVPLYLWMNIMRMRIKLDLLTYDTNKQDHYKITVRHYRVWEKHSWNQYDHIMYGSFSKYTRTQQVWASMGTTNNANNSANHSRSFRI